MYMRKERERNIKKKQEGKEEGKRKQKERKEERRKRERGRERMGGRIDQTLNVKGIQSNCKFSRSLKLC